MRAPWVLAVVKPVAVRIAVAVRPDVVENVGANGSRIFGRALSGGEKRALARGVMGHFYEFVRDVARFRGETAEQIRRHIVKVKGRERYVQERLKGKGAVLVTAHFGSFEAGMAGLCEVEPAVHVVFKRDVFSSFEALRKAFRETLGVKELAIDDGPAALVGMRDALARNEVVLMQGDRAYPGQRSVEEPVCGGRLKLPAGIVSLARLAGSPIVPVFCLREASGLFSVELCEAIDAEDPGAMGKFARALGEKLRAHPEQWLVLQKAFVEDQPAAGSGKVGGQAEGKR